MTENITPERLAELRRTAEGAESQEPWRTDDDEGPGQQKGSTMSTGKARERDSIAIEPMQVRRVEGDPRGSSNIEPQVDDLWGPDDKLSWLLGVACADTGVKFQAMAYGPGGRREYSVQCGNTSFSAVPYYDAWQLVSTLAAGIQIGMGENDRLREEVDAMQLRLNAADWRETTVLVPFAQRTQERDWGRLNEALRVAANGIWSMACDTIVSDIVEAHAVTGTWTPDTAITYGPLLLDGIYEAITGIPVSEETFAGCRDYLAQFERQVFAGSAAAAKKSAVKARRQLGAHGQQEWSE